MASAPPPGEGPAKPPSGSGGVPWRQGPVGWEYQGPDGQWHTYQSPSPAPPPPPPVGSQGPAAVPPPSPPPPPVGTAGPASAPSQPPGAQPSATQARVRRKWPWVVGAAAVLALIVGLAAGSGNPKHHGTSPSSALSSTSTSTNTTFSTRTGSTSTAGSTSTSSTAASLATLPPATTTTAAPGPKTSFSTGTLVVNSQIAPGTYDTPGGTGCYWQRMKNFNGTLTSIIANTRPTGHAIVTILPSDAGFQSNTCGTWRPLTSVSTPKTSFGNGDWAVGINIVPGTYATPGGTGCYWERQGGFTGTLTAILANTRPTGQAVVTISSTDKGFETNTCGTWTLQG